MGMIPFFLFAWLIHLVTSAVIVAPVVFWGRKEARWHTWELLVLVIPFCVWAGLMVHNDSGKTLSNLVVEPGILSVALVFVALARVGIGRSLSEWLAIAGSLVVTCVAASGVYFLVPALPE